MKENPAIISFHCDASPYFTTGVTMTLTKKYQKTLSKVTKLVDIVTSALAVFETSVSKALKNEKIDEQEFNVLQTSYIKTLNELSNINRKIEAENRNQFENVYCKR